MTDNTCAGWLHRPAALESVPDGTIIRWLRIAGDETSEAVAFVRHQVEAHNDLDGRPLTPPTVQTTWISPGGWDPHTIEEAGVRFPCEVVRWGSGPVPPPEPVEPLQFVPGIPMETATLMHGGTWAREKALECAALLYQGNPGIFSLDTAEQFEAWLDRPTEETPDTPKLADLSEYLMGHPVRALADDLIASPYFGSGSAVKLAEYLVDQGWHL